MKYEDLKETPETKKKKPAESITFPDLTSLHLFEAAKEYFLALEDPRRAGEEKEKSEKLSQLLTQTQEIDWDTTSNGMTLAYLAALLNFKGKPALFNRFLESISDKINWHAGPSDKEDPFFGVTLHYWAVYFAMNDDPRLFTQLLKSPASSNNWDAAPENPKNFLWGVTTAYLGFLLFPSDLKSSFITHLSKLPAKLIDWNAGPKNENHESNGASLAYWSLDASDPRITTKFLETPADKIDWNAGPKNKKSLYYGDTVAYKAIRLASEGDSRALNKFLELPANRIDWNGGPWDEKHPNFGVTVAYEAFELSKQGNSSVLNKLLELPANEIDWNAGPKNEKHPDCGVTLAFQAISLAMDGDDRLLNKLLEAFPDKINWSASFKNKENNNYGLTVLCSAAALYLKKKDPRILNKFLESSIENIDCNSGFKNKDHTFYGLTLIYMSAMLYDQQNDLRLLTKCLASSPNNIGWSVCPNNSHNLAQYAVILADKAKFMLLDKLFSSPHASEHIWRSIDITKFGNVFSYHTEHYAQLLMKLNIGVLKTLKEKTVSLPKFGPHHHLHLFIDLFLAGHSANTPSKESKGLDDDEEDRPINPSALNDCLDKLTSKSSELGHLGCFCVAQTFPSLAEEYYQKIPVGSPLYSKGRYEFASLCFANAGGLTSGSSLHNEQLKKAFDTSVIQWFFQSDQKPARGESSVEGVLPPKDSKSDVSVDDWMPLIENVAKSAISQPNEGLMVKLPEEFHPELQEFKRNTSIHNKELMQFKVDCLWKNLKTHKKIERLEQKNKQTQEKSEELEREYKGIKEELATFRVMLEGFQKSLSQPKDTSLSNQPKKRKESDPMPVSDTTSYEKKQKIAEHFSSSTHSISSTQSYFPPPSSHHPHPSLTSRAILEENPKTPGLHKL